MAEYTPTTVHSRSRLASMFNSASSSLSEGAHGVLDQVDRTFGQPGPDIPVRPFAPGAATPAAAYAKILTSLFSASRNRANWQAKAATQAAVSHHTELENQQLEASIKSNAERYPAKIGGQTVPLSRGEFAKWAGTEESSRHSEALANITANKLIELARMRLAAEKDRRAATTGARNISNNDRAARLADLFISRQSKGELDRTQGMYGNVIGQIGASLSSKDPKVQKAALAQMFGAGGAEYLNEKDAGKRAAIVGRASGGLMQAALSRARAGIAAKYAPLRQQLIQHFAGELGMQTQAPAPQQDATDPADEELLQSMGDILK